MHFGMEILIEKYTCSFHLVFNLLFSVICRLQKSIDGLNQASKNWFAKFAPTLRDYGFIQSASDHWLFTFTSNDTFLNILVYVDDIILATLWS